MKAIVDGAEVQEAGEVTLPSDVDGVFETLRVSAGVPAFWNEHWSRFAAGCKWYGLQLAIDSDALRAHALALIRDNKIRNGVLRYAAWTEEGRTTWRVEAVGPRPSMEKKSFRLTIGRVLPPGGPERAFKHLWRTPWNEALYEARARDFDDAILRDANDRIVETCIGNVFFELAGVVRTPGLGSGCLPGVLRAKVIEAGHAAGVKIEEGDCVVEELSEAREILVSNSLVGLVPAAEFEGRELAASGPILSRLATALPRGTLNA